MTAPVLVGPQHDGGPTPSPDVDDVLALVGDRIRAEREARGWSRDQLARRASISSATVRRLEDGNDRLRPLLAACRAFRLPVDYLLSAQWQAPSRRPTLAPRQVEVLREAASGDSLPVVGARLGMGSQAVAAVLSRTYTRLGVADLPVNQRRSAAARVAAEYGLFDAQTRAS
ncbi:MAG: transcriptional regulator [Streptomyces sp.]|nr:transcriptional regulator [Streptomyces sp.]NUS24100.1 transcriptional regulator [Streptomyces sp.]